MQINLKWEINQMWNLKLYGIRKKQDITSKACPMKEKLDELEFIKIMTSDL